MTCKLKKKNQTRKAPIQMIYERTDSGERQADSKAIDGSKLKGGN